MSSKSGKLWLLQLDDRVPAELFAVLDRCERDRCMRLAHSADRTIYAAAHAALRYLLGDLLNLPPNQIKFARSIAGKPRLASEHARHDINISISRTRGFAAIALWFHGQVGVDIERRREVVDCLPIASTLFGEDVRRQLASFDNARRQEIFLQLWTAAEAYVKATGLGLVETLGEIPIALSNEGELILAKNSSWRLHQVKLNIDCAGSVIVKNANTPAGPALQHELITLSDLLERRQVAPALEGDWRKTPEQSSISTVGDPVEGHIHQRHAKSADMNRIN